jgi:Secretion system C-terminal sorting domain/Carboxypeptidase regulatory-like domain
MKRLFQLLFFLALSLSLTAQTYNVNISGTVTDANGDPVEGVDVAVVIATNPNGAGFFYSNFLQTNANGFYEDSIEVPDSIPQGNLLVEMADCDSNLVSQTFGFGMGGGNNFTADFDWCANGAGNLCDVTIEVDSLPGTTNLILTAVPTGTAPFTFYWNNSGGTSNPTLTVTQPGTYCVAVWDAAGCSATACVTVQTGGSNNCDVEIVLDSTAAGGIGLFAYGYGVAPFTYLWNTGETSQSIELNPNMVEYCVTVADANGCAATDCINVFPPSNCSVSIMTDTVGGLTANASGTAPFIYFWNTGETGATIYPNAFGVYCVTAIDADSCAATACYQYGNGGQDSCSVSIEVDSVPPGGAGNVLTALAWGTPPFTYQWNVQNWQTQSITVPGTGTYCVTVTDAAGCESQACVTLGFQPCQVEIVETSDPATGQDILLAEVPANAYYYQWSTGELTAYIQPATPGIYCVTVTHSSGCTATDCFDYDPNFGNFPLKGFVTLPDSTNFALLAGTATLFQFDPLTGEPVQVDDTLLNTTPNGVVNFYDFGYVNEGQYLVKVTLDPNSPYADDYLPTYYGDVLYWDEATTITIPGTGTWFNIVLVEGQGVNGPGVINGTVTDGDGLTANGGDDRGVGDPMPGVSILLLDEQELPITDALTDENGGYNFPDLPYGTYKVVVEITGLDQAFYWVTLSAGNPATTLNFEVTEAGVTGIEELAADAQRFQVFPNPVTNVLHVALDVSGAQEASLMLNNTAGTTVAARHLALAAGQQTFDLNVSQLPSGIYFLQLVSGREVVSRRIVVQ